MRFFYVAQSQDKNVLKGELEAKDRNEVIDILSRKGLTPIKLEQVFKEGGVGVRIFGGRLNTFDQIIIIRQLGTILQTGTDLLTGLEIIAQDAIKPIVKKILYNIKDRVSKGEKFSDALGVWKNQFNPVFISLIKAGETSGNMPNILLSYAKELRKDYTFARKVKGAMVYPVILVAGLLAMIVLVLTIVTPRLKDLFFSIKAEPPIYTKAFFIASDFWLAYTVPISVAFGIFVILLSFAFRNKKLQRLGSFIIWHMPYLNKIQQNFNLMRFCKTVANLSDAGFTLKSALMTTSEVVSLNYRRVLINIAQEKLEKGISFADSLKQNQAFFPKILISTIATGEKSGQLSSVLNQMSEFYEEEIIYSLELFLTLIEPILLVIVGIIVGLMAASLIAPIYKLIGGF